MFNEKKPIRWTTVNIVLIIAAAVIAGICIGSGMTTWIILSILFAMGVIGCIVYFKTRIPPYLLEIKCIDEYSEREVLANIILSVSNHNVISRKVSSNMIESVIEVNLVDISTDFISRISALRGVLEANLISDDEYKKKAV